MSSDFGIVHTYTVIHTLKEEEISEKKKYMTRFSTQERWRPSAMAKFVVHRHRISCIDGRLLSYVENLVCAMKVEWFFILGFLFQHCNIEEIFIMFAAYFLLKMWRKRLAFCLSFSSKFLLVIDFSMTYCSKMDWET